MSPAKCAYNWEGRMTPCGIDCSGSCSTTLCWQHCPHGIAFQTSMTAVEGSPAYKNQQYRKIMVEWLKHGSECHGLPASNLKKSHEGNGAYQGAFAFTLTKSPEDNLTEFDMIKSVRKIMSQKSCPVKRYAWYLEYGDNEEKTHPHIHGLYETESQGRIEAKHWKRAWPIWDEKTKLGRGHRGGYHRPIRSEEGYADYIKKDAGKNEWYNIDGQEMSIE